MSPGLVLFCNARNELCARRDALYDAVSRTEYRIDSLPCVVRSRESINPNQYNQLEK